MAVLEVKKLCKQYTKVLAANNVSFSIDEGEIFALIGPNGAGKTTTIRMISTLIKPTSGDAEVDGHSIIKEPEKVRRSITYLPDEAGAYKTMTGRAYLKLVSDLFYYDTAVFGSNLLTQKVNVIFIHSSRIKSNQWKLG